ncbi:MAG: zinc transporter ZntB [Gammaproteobacteria bacterium]|jgi:zinc transporter
MSTTDQVTFACDFDNNGGASVVDLDAKQKDAQTRWVHVSLLDDTGKAWLKDKSGLNVLVCEAMLAKETRPRLMVSNGGVLIILRSINFHPGDEPDDMLSVRIWIEKNRIITASRKTLLSIREIKEALENKTGPISSMAFLDDITGQITDKIGLYIDKIDVAIFSLEKESVLLPTKETRNKLAEVRSQIVAIRRYISPQRDALSRLTQLDRFPWLTETDRFHFMETSDRTIRCLEDLDEARDRATIIRETISNLISERVEQRMYILSLVAAIFLPLTFLTGLLGINVAGIPGANAKSAFALVTFVMIIIAVIEYILFKKKRWL